MCTYIYAYTCIQYSAEVSYLNRKLAAAKREEKAILNTIHVIMYAYIYAYTYMYCSAEVSDLNGKLAAAKREEQVLLLQLKQQEELHAKHLEQAYI